MGVNRGHTTYDRRHLGGKPEIYLKIKLNKKLKI
jgi:hypothetical protein